jgi:hypothetical protein
MQLSGPYNSGAAVGSNGSATANTDFKVTVSGKLVGIYIRYNHSCPATTVPTIKTLGVGTPSYNLLVAPAGNTDGLFVVKQQVVDPTGALPTYEGIHGVVGEIPVYDGINVKVDLANALDSVDVWLFLE